MVQREFNFSIVDEVDSILIDEARTPLIISGPAEDSSAAYIAANKLMPQLSDEDFEKDEKARSVTFTETVANHMDELLCAAGLIEEGGLFEIQHVNLLHQIVRANV